MSLSVVSAEQVRKEVARAAEHLDVIPEQLRPMAKVGLETLSDDAEKVARIGTLGVAKVWAWGSAFGADAPLPRAGASRAQALERLTAIGDKMQDGEDADREAAAHARKVALDVGLKVVQVLVPLLLAAL